MPLCQITKCFCLFIMTSYSNRIPLWQLSMIYSWQFRRDTQLCIVFEIFAMVNETEFTLLHHPYIGNLNKPAISLEMINTLAKNFEHKQNVLIWGGLSLKKKLNGFVRFGKMAKGNLSLLPPLRAPMRIRMFVVRVFRVSIPNQLL